VLFTFPSRYWSTIGLQVVFSLGRWSCRIRTGFLVPRVTLDAPWLGSLTDTGLSPVSPRLSMRCSPCALRRDGSPNPGRAVTHPVWARPSSIASTGGFTVVFSSSGYLDVSVHRVRPADVSVHRVRPAFAVMQSLALGCPIQTSPDQRSFAPPRSFSQLVTSFFAS